MKSRAARQTLLVLFLMTLGATAYLFWTGESLVERETASARGFDARARNAIVSACDIRAAQQAYVAPGQNVEFWSSRVASLVESLHGTLAALRESATAAEARSEIDVAAATLTDLGLLDKRARTFARSSQNLLASDLIFSDGLEMADTTVKAIEQARIAEETARNAAIRTFRSRQMFALISGAAAAVLVVLLLVPAAGGDRAVPRSVERLALPRHGAGVSETDALDLEIKEWSPARRLAAGPSPVAPTMEPAASEAPPTEAQVAAGPATDPPEPGVATVTDFGGVASLCTDLARISDPLELPLLLERAAGLLDASGIILWIADPDGRELNPIMAQGYPQHLVNRLGVIPREAENATAAAFRTALLQTVKGNVASSGAIAAPLVTPGGCVGVMAAEVRHESERHETRLAAASIVAAQLATLVGPPARQGSRTGAAG
ncbi:MAG TPA: GAF domain-containing protein [Vicinamibacterales bacterium]|nr:GAF domain-containing protein [Vicinamibacterales bacterium]